MELRDDRGLSGSRRVEEEGPAFLRQVGFPESRVTLRQAVCLGSPPAEGREGAALGGGRS